MILYRFGHQNSQQSGQHNLSMKNSSFFVKLDQQTGHNLEERTKIKKERSMALGRSWSLFFSLRIPENVKDDPQG